MSFVDTIKGLFRLRDYGPSAIEYRATTSPTTLVPGRPTKAAGLGRYDEALRRFVQLSRLQTPKDLMVRIRDYNPDAALAVWNTLRLANPGHELEVVYSTGGEEGEPDEEGLALLNEIAERVGTEYGGGLDVLINIMLLTSMTQGAIAAEVELAESLQEIVDYVLVDPALIGFARNDEDKWIPVIAGQGEAVPINTNQFRYQPLDPDVNDPRGRSPFWPALRTAVFQMEVLDDLKAVAHNQGYPRITVKVLREVALAHAPAHLKQPNKAVALEAWLDAYLLTVKEAYDALNPDDTFIGWDGIEIDYTGPGKAGSINLAVLFRALDNQVVASLKQLPILLGRNEAATTTHASIQWQIYVAGIEAFQRPIKRLVEWMYNLSLQIHGRQSKAKITFHQIRKTDRESEARAEMMETRTRILWVQAGWIDNDEAAQEVVGHEAVDEMSIIPMGGEMRVLEGEIGQRQLGPPDPSGGSELALIPYAPAWQQAAYRRMMETYQVFDQTCAQRAREKIDVLRGNGQRGEPF